MKEDDFDTLNDLSGQDATMGWRDCVDGWVAPSWLSLMPRSRAYSSLSRLLRAGFVERKMRARWPIRQRASYLYRITAAGEDALEAEKAMR